MKKRTILNHGDKFGSWTIIKKIGKLKDYSHVFYLCKCKCGFEKNLIDYDLKNGRSQSCQSCSRQKKIEIGVTYGKWTVIKDAGLKKGNGFYYLCKCECKIERTILGCHLRVGISTGCNSCVQKTHGMSKTLIFKRWRSIINRTSIKNSEKYPNYSGRGIKICEKWLNSFENFYQDMGDIPFKNAQIDRIDPDGDYEPSNCRWVTPRENTNNRRNSRANSHKYIYAEKDKLCADCLCKLEKQ